jgi:hypothetical protein
MIYGVLFTLFATLVIVAAGNIAALLYFVSMTDDKRLKNFGPYMSDPFSAHRELEELEEYCRGKDDLRFAGRRARVARLIMPPLYVLAAVILIISIS